MLSVLIEEMITEVEKIEVEEPMIDVLEAIVLDVPIEVRAAIEAIDLKDLIDPKDSIDPKERQGAIRMEEAMKKTWSVFTSA
jgi:hypothetical protein